MDELGIQSLEVKPIARILQEATDEFGEEVCPLAETSMDDIRAIPHGFKLPFSTVMMGLVIYKDKVPLTKGVWVEMGFIMGLRLGLIFFDHLESSTSFLIIFFEHKQVFF